MSDPALSTVDEYLPLHAADLADRLQRLETGEARSILKQLPPEKSAATLVELEEERLPDLAGAFTPAELAQLLRRVGAADSADLLQRLPPATRRDVLAALPPDAAHDVRGLLKYPEETAGGIMSLRFITLRDDMNVEQARALLGAHAQQERIEDVSYIYVTDAGQRLVGIVPLRDLIFRRGDRRVSEIMHRDVKFALVSDDQEALARKFEHYHYLGLPVLDEGGRILGVVKAVDALEIARKEATEDMQLMVGLSGEERALTPWRMSVGRRLPWLMVNLATAFVAALTIGLFESTIAQWTALVVFLPIIAGQGGNAGMQTLTIVIRDLALGEIAPGDGRRALLKESILGLINGLAVGVVVGAIGWLWKGSVVLGVVAAAAMVMNQLAAAVAGVLIPLGLRALRMDPALASSIFLTTVTDVAGFFFFLGLAAAALRWYGA